MNNLTGLQGESEARRYASGVLHPTRFSEAINRYLGAAGYPDPCAIRAGIVPAGPDQPVTGLVVAGVDDTPISYVAADHAAIEASLHGWGLRLVTVRRDAADEAGAALLRRLIDRVHASAPEAQVTGRIAVGSDTAHTLIEQAGDADLLVVGHHHSAVATAIGLSVAGRVLRHHTHPVLVIRVPGWPAEFGTRPLLVAVDGSPASRKTVQFALDEARARGCEVTVLHLVGAGTSLAARHEILGGVPVHHRVLAADPVTALVEASETAAAMVIAQHGLSAPLLEAAARALPQQARCPVFLVS
ncbi:universal stress protein [Actinoplanes sp. NPDC026670]|uniref:universal stress protein n=1 Tax=Actinoplanes sp. NPDC026670 TaxID=3154700 RepID=UPI0033D3658F